MRNCKQCNSSFVISPDNNSSPPYTPANNACGGNVVAYNLMAGYVWFQSSISSSWWLSVGQWKADCITYNSSRLPTTLSTTGINMPSWAFQIPTGKFSFYDALDLLILMTQVRRGIQWKHRVLPPQTDSPRHDGFQPPIARPTSRITLLPPLAEHSWQSSSPQSSSEASSFFASQAVSLIVGDKGGVENCTDR